jgi:hypothetical protein
MFSFQFLKGAGRQSVMFTISFAEMLTETFDCNYTLNLPYGERLNVTGIILRRYWMHGNIFSQFKELQDGIERPVRCGILTCKEKISSLNCSCHSNSIDATMHSRKWDHLVRTKHMPLYVADSEIASLLARPDPNLRVKLTWPAALFHGPEGIRLANALQPAGLPFHHQRCHLSLYYTLLIQVIFGYRMPVGST